ncbi:hypothetical protein [Streptomyces adelaidensis]|uniref:hypothetical protein n=1 Tax=Streptomyces adelaidensis TaxID=2796465 RepID=UPI001907E98B|nr:hypothetical protein [Streptomyces adelaidensis]
MLRITDARTGEPAEVRRALTRVHAHVPRDDASALRVLLVADVLARALELGGAPVLLVADPPTALRERADDLGIRPAEAVAAATGGGRRVLHVTGAGEGQGQEEGTDGDGGNDLVRVEVASVSGAEASAASGTALRLALLARPRRTPVDLDATTLAEAGDALGRWRKAVAGWATRPSKPMPEDVKQALRAAWEDDLDVPAVLGVLRDVAEAEDVPDGARFETYAYADRLLGLELTREIGAPA